MRELASAVYWVLVGGLIGFACCFGLFGLPFLATGWFLGIIVVVAGCKPSALDYIVLLMFFGVMALSGPAWRVVALMRRRDSENSFFYSAGG